MAPELVEHDPAVVPGFGDRVVEGQRARKRIKRLGRPIEAFQHKPVVVERRVRLRGDARRLPEIRLGVGETTKLREQDAEQIQCAWMLRLLAQQLSEGLFGGGELAALECRKRIGEKPLVRARRSVPAPHARSCTHKS